MIAPRLREIPAAAAAVGFAAGVGLGFAWGYAWGHCDWKHGDINVNVKQNFNYNKTINRDNYAHKTGVGGSGTWKHDPDHRKGVAYRDQGTAQKFGKGGSGSAQGRRDFRGFDRGQTGQLGQRGERTGAGDRGQLGGGGFDRGGAVMGSKELKAIAIMGDGTFPLMEGKKYPKLFDEVYKKLTDTDMMSKYHNLGTPVNVAILNGIQALPVRNLQQTSDPHMDGITGETFARDALLRNAACAGCPVGCIHLGFVRGIFQEENRYTYRQISYDHELVFALGSMLGVLNCFALLALIDTCEKMGIDVMSAGVALARATEALEKGVVKETETIVPLRFGDAEPYKEALNHLAYGPNEFYQLLSQGTMKAAARYGGADYACVLGQEMGGYATGEVFFVSQALGFRHSHLDSGGYSYDQKYKDKDKDVAKAVRFLLDDERGRVLLTSMVACLFARGVYTDELLAQCLDTVGYKALAGNMGAVAEHVQRLRWALRMATGYDPRAVQIPKRFSEITTWKGSVDEGYLAALQDEYARQILALAKQER